MTRNKSTGRRTVYTILLSVCLFLGVICACLLVALVLIGRNLATNSKYLNNCTVTTTEIYTNNSLLNDIETFPNETTNEISVKISLNTTDNKLLSTTQQPDWRSGWRLPRDVKPLRYDLSFHPELQNGTFSGRTNITIQTTEARDHFVLHGEKLDIKTVEMFNADNNEKIEVINFHNDSTHQLWVVDLEDSLIPGVYYLVFEYEGNMGDKRVGLYSSTYLDENLNRRYIATSKLEPTYARQAFPCFDEPNYKANYTVHLQIPNDGKYIALSNMDQNGEPEKKDDKHSMVHFNTSVPMSTYVSCFIVCDFEYESDVIISPLNETNKIPLKVYATPAQKEKTKYALGIAKNVTEYYEKYFQIPYPLPKLDMIAIPDFVSGAMEHWGLVTYRETALLYSANTSNAANKQRVATVVAHELAHMWFGNLVTLDWWNDLWLNEGFATYMQFKAIHELIGDWGMADQFLIDELHPVLDFDSTLATHPIVVSVTTPNQITEIFDSISYNKGASVLRMLENAISDEKFQTGITKYLNKHAYKNAVTKDLWVELQSTEPGFNVEEVMDTWTTQSGYPIITMSKENGFILKQKRFLADPDSASQLPPSKNKWSIPITYFTDKSDKIVQVMFMKDQEILKLTVPADVKWIKLNARQVGYYRVNYTPNLWTDLIKDFKNLSAADKTNLLEDAFSIAKTGELNYKTPLDMTLEMKDEPSNYVPWTVTIRKFNELKTLLKADIQLYEKYKKHVLSILDNIIKSVNWENKSEDEKDHQKRLLSGKVLYAACAYGDTNCKQKASEYFQKWLQNDDISLNLDIKSIVFEYGMENINKTQWEQVFDKYVKENDAAEKLKLLKGLASVKDQTLIKTLLDRAENETIVRGQDYFTCLHYISANEYGTDIVWDYVRENWEYLVKRFTLNDRYLGRLIPAITSSFVTQIKYDDMINFFNKYPDAGAGEISRKQALETVKNNINWLNKHKEHVAEWLKDNVDNA